MAKKQCSWDIISVGKNVAAGKWETGNGKDYCEVHKDTAAEGGEVWWSCWAGKKHRTGTNQASIPTAKKAACKWLCSKKSSKQNLSTGLIIIAPIVVVAGYGIYKFTQK